MAHRQDDDADGNEPITADGEPSAERSTADTTTLHRRSALKLFGAAAAAAVGGSFVSGSAAAQSVNRPSNTVNLGDEGLEPGDDISDYLDEYFVEGNEVRVPAGEYEWDGDSGSGTFDDSAWLIGEGEVVLDIGDGSRTNFTVNTADGASGAHVRVRNITQQGIVGGNSRFKVAARDEDSLIEYINVNRPDGTEGDIDESNSIGLYATNRHAGVVRFINCHIEGHTNNGIYASSPGEGDSEDGFGPVEVYGGLYKNNDVNNIRIGTPNSKVVGTTSVFTGPPRGQSGGSYKGVRIRESGENLLIKDCDFTMLDESGAASPIQVAESRFEGPGPSDTYVQDTRIRNESGSNAIDTNTGDYDISGDNIHLTGDGDLEMEGGPYTNVKTGSDADEPTTEKRWYDWQGNSDGTDQPSSPSQPSYDHTLTVETFEDPRSGINYEFTAGGDIAQIDQEANDTVSTNDDGTFTATGTTGGGFDDGWEFNGDLQAWSAETHPDETNGEYVLYVDGQEVDPADYGESDDDSQGTTKTLTVETVVGSGVLYSFTASGEVAGGDSAEVGGNDSLTENSDGTYTVDGDTGNGFADDWTFTGELLSWSAEQHPEEDSGEYTLSVNGEEVDPETVGSDGGSGGDSSGDDTAPLPNRITFDASGGRSGAYSFEVSGDLAADPDTAPLESLDTLSGSTASGEVSDEADSYRFSGDLVNFELTGTASVDIEDTV